MQRHELPSRGHGIAEGLAARVHDPLWLLGRQWQFGEFLHEDAASPAGVHMAAEVHLVDQLRRPDAADWQGYDVGTTPLERLVEEHAGGPTPRLRVEGGLRLRRLLGAAGHAGDEAAFVTTCPFPDAPGSEAGDLMVRRRIADGAALAQSLTRLADTSTRADEIAALNAAHELGASDAALGDLAGDWLAWWTPRVPRVVAPSEDCWDEHRLEHRFALRSSSLPAVELRASEYVGGRLDWSAVDAVPGTGAGTPGQVVEQDGIPAPAHFGGMPVPRLWEMEDAQFDPGSVDAAPIDLGRLMLVSYATVYGNDWFVVPVRLPVGSLSRVTEFVVTDVFSRSTPLTQVAQDVDGWNLFSLTAADEPLVPDQERPTSPWFFLAPTLPASLESRPTDVVTLLRDEMANVGWAVESVVADDHGRLRDRFAQWASRDVEPPPPDPEAAPAYRVATEVPDHWFPLVPEQLEDLESVRLRLVPLTRLVDGVPRLDEPQGTLMPAGDTWLHEEELPRSGVQVTRTWQLARWHDGSRHVWQARRKVTGGGEGSSGLRFDQVEER